MVQAVRQRQGPPVRLKKLKGYLATLAASGEDLMSGLSRRNKGLPGVSCYDQLAPSVTVAVSPGHTKSVTTGNMHSKDRSRNALIDWNRECVTGGDGL